MLERIWIHIQAYTIVVLVNSPALFMLFMSGVSTPQLALGELSNATEYGMVSTFEIHIEPETLQEQTEDQQETATQETSPQETQEKGILPTPTASAKPIQAKEESLPVEKESATQEKTPLSRSQTIQLPPHLKKTLASLESTATKKISPRKQQQSQCKLHPSRRISSVSDTEYSVHQDLVSLYTSQLSKLSTLAQAYWYKGKHEQGILLQKIPCTSPLRNLGLQPKDIILSVNGKSIHNSWSAVEGYVSLKSQKNLDIVLKRGSRQLSMKYHIVKKI